MSVSHRFLRIALSFIAITIVATHQRWKLLHYSNTVDLSLLNFAKSAPSNNSERIFPTLVNDADLNYEIVTTNYGWNTPQKNQFSRRAVTGEFFSAVLNHPRYNASAWEDLESHPDPTRRLIVLMDIDTCIEGNYPSYGKPWKDNLDLKETEGEEWFSILDRACVYIKRAASSPALLANPDSRLVLLDCGDGPYYLLQNVCGENSTSKVNGGGWGDVLSNQQVIIAYYGIEKQYARPIDIGLPPPSIKQVNLMPHERLEIDACRKRDYIFSFQGRGGFRRERLLKLDNGKDVYVRIRDQQSYLEGLNTTKPQDHYQDIMRQSTFGGAPKGDCLWSYRFTEIMSAGSVPVVYSNDWLPPFSSPSDPDRVVNWTKCMLHLREGKFAEKTVNIIREISEEKHCEMQKCALAFWDAFGSSREGWLNGILRWVNYGHVKNS